MLELVHGLYELSGWRGGGDYCLYLTTSKMLYETGQETFRGSNDEKRVVHKIVGEASPKCRKFCANKRGKINVGEYELEILNPLVEVSAETVGDAHAATRLNKRKPEEAGKESKRCDEKDEVGHGTSLPS